MKQVKINLTDELDFNEYRKQICFFSQKITSFRREGNSLIIEWIMLIRIKSRKKQMMP